ncbi:hypothetical protein JCM19233_3087 [Vibrio astriarenae]|nr:hypothetical protein JCM19233_3087 [Vibrio sp. C7]
MKVLGERVAYFELLKESSEHHHTHVKKQLARMTTWLPKVGLAFTIVLLGGLIMTAVAQLYFSF